MGKGNMAEISHSPIHDSLFLCKICESKRIGDALVLVMYLIHIFEAQD